MDEQPDAAASVQKDAMVVAPAGTHFELPEVSVAAMTVRPVRATASASEVVPASMVEPVNCKPVAELGANSLPAKQIFDRSKHPRFLIAYR